jgi:subtilisin family serine protease
LRARSTAALTAMCLFGALLAGPARAASSDPLFKEQWGLHRIQAEQAWTTADGTGAVIAIVDGGVDLGHPDLADKLIVHPGADFVEQSSCPTSPSSTSCVDDGPLDEDGHGTHVAGIAGALTGNGIGVAGTAPGAELMPVRVLGADGDGTTSDLADGIRFAADKGADVINVSANYSSGQGELTGLTGGLRPVRDAIEHALGRGAVVVVSAGNDAVPLCAEPAAHARVLCVGAVGRNDLPARYSNRDIAMTKNFLVAPGGEGLLSCAGEILSTYLRTATASCSGTPGYEAISGTSMAAPFVSGVAALLASKGLSATDITSCIVRTATDLGSAGRDPIYGHGLVNAARAVSTC